MKNYYSSCARVGVAPPVSSVQHYGRVEVLFPRITGLRAFVHCHGFRY